LKKTIAAPEKKSGDFNEAIQALLAIKLKGMLSGSGEGPARRKSNEDEDASPTKPRPEGNNSLSNKLIAQLKGNSAQATTSARPSGRRRTLSVD